jgi:hypothetical protein
MNSIHLRISIDLCLRLQKIGLGFSFFQYFITPVLHKYVEQSKFMDGPLPGDEPKPGLLGQGSLLAKSKKASFSHSLCPPVNVPPSTGES